LSTIKQDKSLRLLANMHKKDKNINKRNFWGVLETRSLRIYSQDMRKFSRIQQEHLIYILRITET